MISKIRQELYIIRRELLKKIVPEFIWPKHVIMDGAEVPIRNMPFSFGVKRILSKDDYEVSERKLMNEILLEGDIVLELGGSIGILATIVQKKVGKSGFIVSVEASKTLSDHSRKRLEPNGNVKILTGIGFPVWQVPDSFKTVSFLDDGNSLGGMVDFSKTTNSSEYRHKIYDISTIVDEYKVEPVVLLIDIEGSEIVFLEKSVSVPGYIRNIVIELHPGLYGSLKEKEIVNAICSFGFTLTKEISHVYLFSK